MLRRTQAICAIGALAIVTLPTLASAQLSVPAWAVQKEVLVILIDAAPQSGILLALSPTAAVFRQRGKDVRLPLTRVRRVVTTSRTYSKGVMLGTLIGAVGGAVLLDCKGSECPAPYISLPITGGIGAALGAAAGAIMVRLRPPTGPQRVVYQAAPSGRPGLTPVFAPSGRGIAVTVRW